VANRLFANAAIVGFLFALWNSGCERSATSPGTFPSSPVFPGPTPPGNPNPPQALGLTVNAISPAVGVIGDVVRVTGTGFAAGSTVTLGGEPARVTSTSFGFIVAIAPAHPVGEVDVTVTNQDGERATLARGYAYDVVTLKASTDTIAAGGEPLTVSWTAPRGRPLWDWIALIKVGASTGTYSEGWWDYTKGAASGAMTFRAPVEPGRYEFRYMVDDGFTEAARSGPVTVTPSEFPSIRGDRTREK
jgi:hypothetical protein